jgi:hypothetical protein
MNSSLQDAGARAATFARDGRTELAESLGHGNDGSVWRTARQSAVKAIYRQESYLRERDCYRRLLDSGIRELVGFRIPELLDYDDRLQIIEMSIVFPPCLLDFGKAYVDVPPDYSPEALAEAEAAEQELFTQGEWKQVRLVRAALLNLGIHYFDARPSNIMFPRRP